MNAHESAVQLVLLNGHTFTWLAAVLAAVGGAVALSFIEVSALAVIQNKWAGLVEWWRGPIGLMVRFGSLAFFFALATGAFAILAWGVLTPNVGPQPVVLVIAAAGALMMTFFATLFVKTFNAFRAGKKYEKSSDGSWSAG